MLLINYYTVFYLLTVADDLKVFLHGLGSGLAIFGVAAVSISGFVHFIDYNDDKGSFKWNGWSKYPIITGVLLVLLSIIIPTKRDSLLIIAGGGTMNFLTQDSAAKQIPHELSNFLVTEIKNLAADAQIRLDSKELKQQTLDKVKEMTKEELLNKIQTDTSFVNALK